MLDTFHYNKTNFSYLLAIVAGLHDRRRNQIASEFFHFARELENLGFTYNYEKAIITVQS